MPPNPMMKALVIESPGAPFLLLKFVPFRTEPSA
jgi:hypothetical protein